METIFISGRKRRLYDNNTTIIPCSSRGSVICGRDGSLLDKLKIAPAVADKEGIDFNYLDLSFSENKSEEIVGERRDLLVKPGSTKVKLYGDLVEHINADKYVFITGCSDHIEIWKLENWKEYLKGIADAYEELFEKLIR
tara:strand:- start:2695 stop:3114 length:420 start_codon:yes stop_codon:yes gene_type:complete